jgi:hypothetical protein
MNNSMKYKHSLLLLVACISVGLVQAQQRYKESFKVGDDALVSVNTTYTNVIIETWNKNTVEVEAFVDGEELTAEERKEIFDNWSFDVLGNSKKVVVTSNEGSLWSGFDSFESLEGLSYMEGLKALEDMPALDMDNFDFAFDFEVPEIPETDDFPNWPFTDDQPSVSMSKNGSNIQFSKDTKYKFDRDEYEDDKQGYVNKLNRKYNSNVSVSQVDRWLDDVDEWSENFEKVMEKWGEDFGKDMEEKFGPDFERKMEKWGEEYAKKWEAWGEEFGEQFGKDMEKWGEEFGEKFGEDIEKWAEEFAKQFEEDGNVKVIIDDDDNNLFIEKDKVQKTIIIRMPKGTRTDINVRHGEVKMADATNLKATLNYSTLTANSIDGGGTLINASYAPVYVNDWKNGALYINYVDDCKLNSVDRIRLEAVSSDVNILSIAREGRISGSFGNLFINKIGEDFDRIDITLENTDATIKLPRSSFLIDYDGKRSRVSYPDNVQLTKTSSNDRTLLEGYKGSSNAASRLSVTARYSKVVMQ